MRRDDPFTAFTPGDFILLHLVNPSEKFWGVLLEIGVAGVTLRGISVSSFDDWMAQAARHGGTPGLGLSTMFLPLFRVERMFRDEAVGEVESYAGRFQRRVGTGVREYLGLEEGPSVAGDLPS
jgi:hypothetical protein